MNYKVVFSPAASNDLEDLFIYLAAEMGGQAARKYVRRIRAYCAGFSTFPARGVRREDLWPNLRLVGYRRKATIAFVIRGDTVRIARIYKKGQNIETGDYALDPDA